MTTTAPSPASDRTRPLDAALGGDIVRAIADRLGGWLVGSAFPRWAGAGFDERLGAFNENLSLADGRPVADYKRLRVQARQIYVFTLADRLGFAPARGLVDRALAYMTGAMRSPDGGFVARLGNDGTVIDGKRDLYDQAFVLFALAHAHRMTGRADLAATAEELLAFIRTRFAHPAGGYVEALPPSLPRRQNPHMHLLEAVLAWSEIADGPWRAEADGLVALAHARFISRGGRALTEYFEDDWSAQAGPAGAITEPGHHFEWVWLLSRHAALTGRRSPATDTLYAFAYAHGIDPALNQPFAEVSVDGVPSREATRLWTSTEWMKAELAMLESGAGGHHAARAALAAQAIAAFLDPAGEDAWPTGLWRERRQADGRFIEEAVPASSLYHVTLAIAEARRLAGL